MLNQVSPAQSAAAAQEASDQAADSESCFGTYAILNQCADPYLVTATVQPEVTMSQDNYFALKKSDDCEMNQVTGHWEGHCSVEGGSGQRVMLLGDSYAAQWFVPLEQIAQEEGWSLELRNRSGCSGLGPAAYNADAEQRAGCEAWTAAVYEEIVTGEPYDLVMVTARSRLYHEGSEQGIAALDALANTGASVVVIESVPGTGETPDTWGENAPACVETAAEMNDPCASAPFVWDDYLSQILAEASGAVGIDPREILCSDDGLCHVVIGGTIVYRDDNHLSQTFAQTLAPWLKEKVAPLV